MLDLFSKAYLYYDVFYTHKYALTQSEEKELNINFYLYFLFVTLHAIFSSFILFIENRTNILLVTFIITIVLAFEIGTTYRIKKIYDYRNQELVNILQKVLSVESRDTFKLKKFLLHDLFGDSFYDSSFVLYLSQCTNLIGTTLGKNKPLEFTRESPSQIIFPFLSKAIPPIVAIVIPLIGLININLVIIPKVVLVILIFLILMYPAFKSLNLYLIGRKLKGNITTIEYYRFKFLLDDIIKCFHYTEYERISFLDEPDRYI